MVMSMGLGSPQEGAAIVLHYGQKWQSRGSTPEEDATCTSQKLPHGPQVRTSVGAVCPLPIPYTQAPTPFPSVHTEINATLLLGTAGLLAPASP